MKLSVFSLIFLFIVSVTNAQHEHNTTTTDKPSTHGMLIFGKEKIYASHLPMFHSPHNYQIILELELDENTKKLFIQDQDKNPKYNSYTIEPEDFILPNMIGNPKPFKANLYRGHFERGGKEIASNVVVKIKQVIFYKKFNPDEVRSATTNFILFGNSKEQFMVHEITNKLDFDQIIEVKTDLAALSKKENYTIIKVNKSENSAVGVAGNDIEINNNGIDYKITLLRQLYLEFDDLKSN